MSDAMLNTAKVQKLIEKEGRKQNWIIQQMGLGRTAGYHMLRDGLLPKDVKVRFRALETLADILDVEVREILLRPEAMKAS